MTKNNDEKNEQYSQLIKNIPAGFALHEMIYNETGEPVDYRFLEVNPAFEELTGLKAMDIIGKACLEVMPKTEPVWIKRYGKVILTGKTDHFKNYAQELNKHFEVTAFRTSPDHFACVFHDVTEHIELADSLKASEQDLKEAQDIAKMGRWKLDLTKNTLEWSDEIFNIFEIDKDKFGASYEAFLDAIHPDDRDMVNNAYTDSLESKLPYHIQHRLLMKDGRIKWVTERCKSEYDKDGNPIRSVGILQEITERKKAEEEIIKTEVQYHELVNTINSGVAVYKVLNDGEFGKDYIILDFNKTALEIEQMKLKDVVNKSLVDIRPNIDDYGLIPIFQKVWETGEPAFFPAKQYVDDKYSNYYENRVFRLPDGNIVAIYDDVTDRENALLEIEQNRERLDLALNATEDGIFDWNLETNGIYYTPSWKKILGYKDDELPNDFSVWENLTEPQDVKRSWKMLNEMVNGERENFEMEFKMKHKDGHWVDILSRAKALFNDEGKAVRVIGTHVDISERKKSEIIIKESEEKYRSLVEGSIQGMVVAQKDPLRISFASLPMEKISGYSTDEIISFNPEEIVTLIHKDDRKDFFNNFEGRFSGGDVDPNKKYRLIHKNGDVVWVEVFSTVIKYNGEPAVQAAFIDITERHKAEESLRIILDSSPFPTAVVDVNDEKIKYWSKSAVNLIGYNPETTFEWYELAYPDPDYRKEVVDRWKTCLGNVKDTNEAVNTGEYLIKCKDGTVKTCELFAQFIPGYLIVTLNDITEQKKAAETLIKNQKRYEKAQEMGHVGNWEYDPQTTLFWASDEAKRIYGFDIQSNDFTTEKVENCIPERESVHQALIDLVEHNKPYNLIFDIITHDKGVRKTIHSIAEVERDDQGNPLKVTGVISDITEKKKLENYLLKSQKLESLGLLAGGIAHDFNNILSAIMGFTEIAAMKTSEKEISEYLKKSLTSIERAQALTRQLLTFAKGGEPVKKIGKLFPFVEDTVNFALSGSSVSSKFNIEENLWPCDFDKNQIGQVIDNLTINAKQAMSGGGTIEVAAENLTIIENAHPVLDPGKYIKISLKDQGVGIPKEYLTKIFDPYYSTKPKGHGLGLATCYSIIQKHDGYIEVESEPGKGSTFNIFIPATDKPVDVEKTIQISQHKGSGIFLVMDDEESIRDIVREMLESFGYEVVLKTNGNETIDYLKEKAEENSEIAGMIFDLTIPGGMGGKEAVKEVKKIYPDVPIFVASGYSEDPIVSNPEDYGFNASIRKPFKLSDLSEMLEKYMKK